MFSPDILLLHDRARLLLANVQGGILVHMAQEMAVFGGW